jgi:hypothetical protein
VSIMQSVSDGPRVPFAFFEEMSQG